MPYLISALIALVVSVGSLFVAPKQELTVGADATLPIAGTNYSLSGSGVSSNATSIGLVSFTIPQTGREILDADLSSTFYLTLEPGSRTRQEIVSCTTVTQSGTDTTATLSGCTRGLLPFSPFTASSSYAFAHGGGTSVILSNPPQLYNEFASKVNDESIAATWTFSSTTFPRLDVYKAPTDDKEFATKRYVDSVATSGSPDAGFTIKGIVELGNQGNLSAASSSGYTTAKRVVPIDYYNATSSATTTVPVTKENGKLSQGFSDLTEPFTFSGGVTSSGATALSTTTITGSLSAASSSFSATTTMKDVVINGVVTGSGISNNVGWSKLGETTLSGTATSVTVSALPARKNMTVFFSGGTKSGADTVYMMFNGDHDTNYSYTASQQGAADAGSATTTAIRLSPSTASSTSLTADIFSPSGENRRVIVQAIHDRGIMTVPLREEVWASYVTSTAISSITIWNGGNSVTFPANTYMTVYGGNN